MKGCAVAALALPLVGGSVPTAAAGEVVQIDWASRSAAPPAEIAGERGAKLLPLVRFGVNAVPEAKLMQAAGAGGWALGMPAARARELNAKIARRYREIEADPEFATLPSALPYCYSRERPNRGLAAMRIPDGAGEGAPALLFLHGYGGSFTYYLHTLARTFPRAIILCPAYGISGAEASGDYLHECVDAASQELGFALPRPILIGLSAGGFGAAREYARSPDRYAGLIVLGAVPPDDALPRLPRAGRVRLLAGADETFVRDRVLDRAELALRRRVPDYESRLIPGADHFFWLSHEEAATAQLRAWARALADDRPPSVPRRE